MHGKLTVPDIAVHNINLFAPILLYKYQQDLTLNSQIHIVRSRVLASFGYFDGMLRYIELLSFVEVEDKERDKLLPSSSSSHDKLLLTSFSFDLVESERLKSRSSAFLLALLLFSALKLHFVSKLIDSL
jgi:hypothetical protein